MRIARQCREAVLRDVLGGVRVADDAHRGAVDHVGVTMHDHRECVSIAGDILHQQVSIGCSRRGHDLLLSVCIAQNSGRL